MCLIEGGGRCAERHRLPAADGTLEAEPEHAGPMNRGNELKAGEDAGFFRLGGAVYDSFYHVAPTDVSGS